MKLGERQKLFSFYIAKLILEMYARGYRVSCGDFMAKRRDPLEHKANSLHYEQCAADLNLFKDGKYLTTEEHHRQFAEYWESLHPHCRSGIRYGDANHYELLENPKPKEKA